LGNISKFLKLIVFGQILAILAFAVTENMPKARLESKKSFNSSTMNLNTTWIDSLESYHLYLQPLKVFKNPLIYCIHSTLPTNLKSHFAYLNPLGVNNANQIPLHTDEWRSSTGFTNQSKIFLIAIGSSYLLNYLGSLEKKKKRINDQKAIMNKEFVGGSATQ
jgi:hypothetical protein